MSAPVLASYDFVAHYRRGAASDLANADPLQGALPARGPLALEVTLKASAPNAPDELVPAASSAVLYGPGDVRGIDPRQVIRTEPRDGTPDYEPNYFAGIELDHPELPWMFTPAAPSGDRLRPWIVLITLADGEFKDRDGFALPAIEVASSASLPNLSESWAWAHVQVSGGTGGASVEKLQVSEPHRVLSRLLCPRRLKPLTHYTSFVVPAFDVGVQAGLGKPPPAVQARPAWDPAAAASVILPVYYRFRFHTSERGDFESLVCALIPRVLPKEVGIRDMDVDRPGFGVRGAGPPLGLSGALRSLQTQETTWTGPDRDAFQSGLADHVNASAAPLDDPAHDPIVEPPLYGRWHAARTTMDVTGSGWFDGLNQDPRTRTMAGFGTRVVLDQRAPLMHAAWEQVDGINKANQIVRQGQLARATSLIVHDKRFEPADDATLLALTEPLHKRVLASPTTVRATLAGSALPPDVLSPALRRVAGGAGPIRRRQGERGHGLGRMLRRINDGRSPLLPSYRPPGGFVGLGESASGQPPVAGAGGLLSGCSTVLLVGLALALAAIVLAIGAVAGAFAVGGIVAVVIVGVIVIASVMARGGAGETPDPAAVPDPVGGGLTEAALTPPNFTQAPDRPGFAIVGSGTAQPAGNWPGGAGGGGDSAAGAAFRAAGSRLAGALGPFLGGDLEPEEPKPVPLGKLATAVLERVDPATTVPARIATRISVLADLATVRWIPEALEEIMAAPEFPQPMYVPLRDRSQDLLLPGLDLIPANTLGLLAENHAFIESYMVGLNHEMGRHLLWNRYPTDQRGSYFRQFWDVSCHVPTPDDPPDPAALRDKLKDVPRIHTWPPADPLGQHRNRPHLGGDNLILLVRGDLLRRYPNTVVYACQAVWNPTTHQHDIPDPEVHKHPEFRGTLSPDVTFFGFELTEEEARGDEEDRTKPQGWFFVFQQQPSEPRFGLEPEPDPFVQPPVNEWNDVSWANTAPDAGGLAALVHASPTTLHGVIDIKLDPDGENAGDPDNRWGTDAAQLAFITLRRPARVAVHAVTMLPPKDAQEAPTP